MPFYEDAIQAFRAGDTDLVRELSERELEAARAAGDPDAEVEALCMLARVGLRDGELERVTAFAAEAYGVARASDEQRLERIPLHMKAVAARMAGDHALARRLYEKSIELNRSLGDEHMAAVELHNLGYVELHEGRLGRAKELFGTARLEAERLGYDAMLPYLVADAAVVAAEEGDPSRAARLFGAARAAFAAAGEIPDPDDAAEQELLEARLVEALGQERFAATSEEGAALSPEDALARFP
jgi:tetratricopeptide (TPR) repeat protein